jgi:hypothetical protein
VETDIPKTRQDFLKEAVANVSKITEQDIASVLDAMCAQAKEESQKSGIRLMKLSWAFLI